MGWASPAAVVMSRTQAVWAPDAGPGTRVAKTPPGVEGVDGHRPGQVVALRDVAADAGEGSEHLGGLEHHLVLQRLHVPARLAGCFAQLGGPVTVDRARSAAAAVGVVEHHRLVPVPDAHVLGQRRSSVESLRRGGRVGVVDGA
jgi:hypothetical protein